MQQAEFHRAHGPASTRPPSSGRRSCRTRISRSPETPTPSNRRGRSTSRSRASSQQASYGIFDGDVWCDANGQVYTHSDSSSDQIALGIYGWTDDRGQYQ